MDEKDFEGRLDYLRHCLEEAKSLRDRHLEVLVQANQAVESMEAVMHSLGAPNGYLDALRTMKDMRSHAAEKASEWQGKWEAYNWSMNLWSKK